MKKSELKRIIQEELKGYSKYAPGGETKGGTTDDFRNILTTIAKSVPKEDEEAVNEESEKKTYRVYYYTMDKRGDDLDWDEEVQATSEEDAIAQVKAKGIRNARAFSAKLK